MNSNRTNPRSVGPLSTTDASGNRSGSLNRRTIAAAILFMMVFAIALWYETNSRPESVSTPVQLRLNAEPRIMSAPEQNAPDPDIPATVYPRQDHSAQTTSEQALSNPGDSAQAIEVIPDSADIKSEIAQASQESTPSGQTTEPVGDLAISGRVMDGSGRPVEGIQVVATAYNLVEPDAGRGLVVSKYQRGVTSGYDGNYRFEGLMGGEYRLSTIATDSYPRTEILVRAGVDFADIILSGQLQLKVHGVIASDDGEPLVGVQVSPMVNHAYQAFSGEDGRYEFDLEMMDNTSELIVNASKSGYQTREMRLDIDSRDSRNFVELNISMKRDEDATLAEVSGLVRGGSSPISGQQIQLSSPTARKSHHAKTDAGGGFVIEGVQPGDDYMLSINAPSAYKDYFQDDIRITKSGMKFDIELEAQDTGTLGGQMVNVDGAPVSNFTMVLKTREPSYYYQRVLGDSGGRFEADNVPAGDLVLKTESMPYFIIDGIKLTDGSAINMPVVLDWGYDEILGKVVNQDGYPVAVSSINLTWSYQYEGLRSTSRRTTASDQQGNFYFTQLGPGVHKLTINASGYKPVAIDHDASLRGSALEVTLSPDD